MSVTFTVLESAGDFRMADFYEQANSYSQQGTATYLAYDHLDSSATIYTDSSFTGAFFGGIDVNASVGNFTPVAVLHDTTDPAGTVDAALRASLDAGMTGTQAIAALMAGDDIVAGFRHDDELWAFSGDDRMIGFAGDDILHGGAGDDYLQGDRGADVLEGGKGRDRFVFLDVDGSTPGGWGQDVIVDFHRGQDRIQFLDTHGVHRFADLTITASHGDAVIATGGGDTITLKGVEATTLTAGDFRFAHASQAPLEFGTPNHPPIDALLADGLVALA